MAAQATPPVRPQPAPDPDSITIHDVTAEMLGSLKDADRRKVITRLFGPTLDSLLSEKVEQDVAAEKIVQYLRWRRADLYYRGLHHIYPEVTSDNQITLGGGGVPSFTTPSADSPIFDYNFNVVKSYGEKFTAVLGQRPFHENHAVPNDPSSEADREAARQADLASLILNSWWNVRLMNIKLAHSLWKSGTTFPYLRWVTSGRKYGYTEVPKMGVKTVEVDPAHYECLSPGCTTRMSPSDAEANGGTCLTCGAPLGPESFHVPETVDIPVQLDETVKYPNGRVELRWMNSTMVTVPFYAREREDCPWLVLDSDEPSQNLISIYPDLRETIVNSSASASGSALASQGSLARSGAQSQSGTPRSQMSRGLVPYRRLFLRPESLELVTDEAVRIKLKDIYPDGLKLVKIGADVVDAVPEKLDDHWPNPCQPVVGDYIMVDGVCWGILGHQDIINDFAEIAIETLERGLPTTIVEAGLLDVDKMNARRYMPQEIIETSTQAGTSLDSSIKTIPAAKFPDQLQSVVGWVDGQIQSQTGMLPQVFGMTDSTRKTAEQARAELNQALMQLGTTGEYMTDCWIQCREIGVKLLAQHAPNNLSWQGQTLDLEALKAGNFHFEAEVGIPRTYSERKDALKDLLNSNTPASTAVVESLKITDPSNAGALRQMFDLPDLEDPQDDHRAAVEDVLKALLQGKAIPQPDGSFLPSIPFEDFTFDPQFTLQMVHSYILEPAVRAQEKTNPAGYQNVVAYGMAIQKMISAQNQPPPPPPPKLSETMDLSKMPPAVTAQVLAKYGINMPPPPTPMIGMPPGGPAPAPGAPPPGPPQGPPPTQAAPPPGPPAAGPTPLPPGAPPA